MNLHSGVYAPLLLLLSLLIFGVVSSTPASAQIAQRETLYVDDSDGAPYYAETGSTWVTYTSFGWNGSHRYLTLDDPSNINQTARWTPDIATAGYYAVSFYVPRTSNSRNHVLYVVSASGTAPDSSWHDQNYNSGYFINLGVHYLPDETGSFVEAVNDSTSTSGYSFRADAIRYIMGPDERAFEPGRRNDYDYGEVALLNSKDWPLRIYNIGGTTLTVYDIAFGNSDVYFLHEPSPPVDIEPRDCEDFMIRFQPTAEQIIEDTLRIISNDDDEPNISIPLRGTGVAPFVLVNDDDGAPGYVEEAGEWKQSAGAANCPGIANSGSRYVIQGGNLGARATFTPHIPFAGYYPHRVRLACDPRRQLKCSLRNLSGGRRGL